MKTRNKRFALTILFLLCTMAGVSHAADGTQQKIQREVDTQIRPLIAKYGDRFQMQDLDKVKPVASGLLGDIRLVVEGVQ